MTERISCDVCGIGIVGNHAKRHLGSVACAEAAKYRDSKGVRAIGGMGESVAYESETPLQKLEPFPHDCIGKSDGNGKCPCFYCGEELVRSTQ